MPLSQYFHVFGQPNNLLHGANNSLIVSVRILQKNVQRRLRFYRWPIGTWCNTRTENIAGSEDTRRRCDIAAPNAPRIAAAVETFVHLK